MTPQRAIHRWDMLMGNALLLTKFTKKETSFSKIKNTVYFVSRFSIFTFSDGQINARFCYINYLHVIFGKYFFDWWNKTSHFSYILVFDGTKRSINYRHSNFNFKRRNITFIINYKHQLALIIAANFQFGKSLFSL